MSQALLYWNIAPQQTIVYLNPPGSYQISPIVVSIRAPIDYFFEVAAALVFASLLVTTGFTPASWNISTSRFAMYLSSPSFSSQVENPKLF